MPAIAKTDRNAILKAAGIRLGRDGLAALSLRLLAADLGIATNAIYHYFPSRSDLEDALSDLAASRMHTFMERDLKRRARQQEPSPTARVTTLASAYLRFAQREPHLYAAMINGPCNTDEPRAGHTALWNLVYQAAAALHGEANATDAAVSLWALLHGTLSLLQSGALQLKPEECIRFGLEAWLHKT